MSMSDFLVQRILASKVSTSSPEPNNSAGITNERNASIVATVPKASPGLPGIHGDTGANSIMDYAAALQLMQLQMFCQPGLLSSFLNQMAAVELAMRSGLNKVTSSTESSTDACAETAIRERKRAASRCSDETLPTKRSKLARRLAEDSETSSPVSGMFIKEASSIPPADELQAAADLDDTAIFVNVSEESRRKIEQITNVIGDCICALCKVRYDNVFRLAQHRCPRIIHEEYRCPECDKVFSCPANLASHRRWHKPRGNTGAVPSSSSSSSSSSSLICTVCLAIFDTKKALKQHSAHCARISPSDHPAHKQNPLLQLLRNNVS